MFDISVPSGFLINNLTAIAWSPDDKIIVFKGIGSPTMFIDFETRQFFFSFPSISTVHEFSFSPDG